MSDHVTQRQPPTVCKWLVRRSTWDGGQSGSESQSGRGGVSQLVSQSPIRAGAQCQIMSPSASLKKVLYTSLIRLYVVVFIVGEV